MTRGSWPWTNSDGQQSYAQTPIERWEQDDARTVDPDPKHETPNVLRQIQNNNAGFVADYAAEYPDTTPAQRQILKLFAWADRGAGDPRDAIDLAMLLRQYGVAGNEDRLYGSEIRVLEAVSYDLDLAGARLLGRDAARMSGAETQGKLVALLDDGQRLEHLVRAMARNIGAAPDPVAAAGTLVDQFRTGLREI